MLLLAVSLEVLLRDVARLSAQLAAFNILPVVCMNAYC